MDGDVVQDHIDRADGVGRQQRGEKRREVSGALVGGEVIVPLPGAQVEGAEDRALGILPRRDERACDRGRAATWRRRVASRHTSHSSSARRMAAGRPIRLQAGFLFRPRGVPPPCRGQLGAVPTEAQVCSVRRTVDVLTWIPEAVRQVPYQQANRPERLT